MRFRLAPALLLVALSLPAREKPRPGPQRVSELDRFVAEAIQGAPDPVAPGPGSLYRQGAPMLDLAADIRARRVNDLVTIIVVDRASAVARGATKSARSSSAQSSIESLAGKPPGGARLPNLLKMSGDTQLDGQGETSRETVLNTTLTARVTHVLPNGLLVVEGAKSVRVNSDTQQIGLRGIVRPVDLSTNNQVFSNYLGMLEITVNGKGLISDAVRRPNILYRLLLGLLPF